MRENKSFLQVWWKNLIYDPRDRQPVFNLDKKIVSIIPLYDNVVWHEKGSYLEGAMQNIEVKTPGHTLILKDKKVWDIVVEWIEKISRL